MFEKEGEAYYEFLHDILGERIGSQGSTSGKAMSEEKQKISANKLLYG